MKRVTITIADEQHERLCAEARQRGLSMSELIRERLDDHREARRRRIPGFVGLVDKQLPYTAEQVDDELAKTFGRD
jgi:hypothetical protein